MVLNTYVLWLRPAGLCPEAIELTQQAIQTNPNLTRTLTGIYNELSTCKTWTGHAEEGLSLQDEADRLNPLSPYKLFRYGQMGWISLMLGKDQDAIMFLSAPSPLATNLALPIHHGDTGFSRQPMPAPAGWRRRSITYQRRINSGRTTPFAVARPFC